MIIYKITNNINQKHYIGQTTQSLKKRWTQHKGQLSTKHYNKPLYNAMKKYGVENFKIEEIGGANSLSELNYQEWLLIYKYDSLWPGGYNLKEGGSRGNHSYLVKTKMSRFNSQNKKVINIETGEIYRSARECARKNKMNISTFSGKLNGSSGNNTSFRYVNQEYLSKPFIDSSKKVINIETGKTYNSCSECAKKNGLNNSTLSSKLLGKTGNETPFRYLGQEHICKRPVGSGSNMKRKIINTKTGNIYDSIKECATCNGINQSTLNNKLLKSANDIDFKYLEE